MIKKENNLERIYTTEICRNTLLGGREGGTAVNGGEKLPLFFFLRKQGRNMAVTNN